MFLFLKYCIIKTEKDLGKLNSIIKFSKNKNKTVACLITNKVLSSNIKTKKKRK